MKESRIIYSLIVLASILAFTVGSKDATAVPVTGEIGFMGQLIPINSSSAPTTDFSVAAGTTGLHFVSAWVIGTSGDFSVIPVPNFATYTDFQFSPLFPSPVDPLWTTSAGGITAEFEMTSVSITQQTVANLDLAGTGILKLNVSGLDPTPGLWTFSGDTAGGTFSFSAGNAAVPEPGTLSLLGIGLIGLVGLGVRRKVKKEES